MESHGKQYAWQKEVLKIEKITDKSETGFNFRRNIHKHMLCIIMLESMLSK